MREILFRGLNPEDLKWVYGNYFLYKLPPSLEHENPGPIHFIKAGSETAVIVLPGTVGQFTGLKDRNGEKIFEGDILDFDDGTGDAESDLYLVFWHGTEWKTMNVRGCIDRADQWDPAEWTIVGNIHENPEFDATGIWKESIK